MICCVDFHTNFVHSCIFPCNEWVAVFINLNYIGPNNFDEANRLEADVETSSVTSSETGSLRNSFSTDVKRISLDSCK